MSSEQLQFGNWVIGITGNPIKLTSESQIDNFSHSFSGINLTKEMLETIGFTEAEEGVFEYIYDDETFRIEYHTDSSYSHIHTESKTFTNIDYLHELQNIFRFRTQQDLVKDTFHPIHSLLSV